MNWFKATDNRTGTKLTLVVRGVENNLKGNENCFENWLELARARVTKGKVAVYDGPGILRNRILVRVITWFALARA